MKLCGVEMGRDGGVPDKETTTVPAVPNKCSGRHHGLICVFMGPTPSPKHYNRSFRIRFEMLVSRGVNLKKGVNNEKSVIEKNIEIDIYFRFVCSN